MNPRHLTLAGRIRADLAELQHVVQRATTAWERASLADDDLYLDSVALNLHAFYSGVETLFEPISREIDDTTPATGHGHQQLLRQMAVEIPHTRARVISPATYSMLDEYRSFRQVVRNVYAFNLLPTRMQPLIESLHDTFHQLQAELMAFVTILETNHDNG